MNLTGLLNAMPGAVAQGIIWGIMAIGVYITFRILDLADLTVDGSMVTGMAVCAMMMAAGWNVWIAMLVAFIAGMIAGLVTGLFHTVMGIPAILAGILTQLITWSVNLKIMGKANQALPARTFDVLITQLEKYKALVILFIFCVVIVALLYAFFGTKFGASIRATGCNEKMARAHIDNRKMQYLYESDGMYVFMDNETYEQTELTTEQLADAKKYLKENMDINLLMFNGRIIGVDLPNTVELEVTECDPGVRGDTATGATKLATLATGYVVKVPLFINQGDVLRIDTRTGAYIERA